MHRGSTRGSMVSKSPRVNSPFGCTLSDLKVPPFNKAQSALDTSNIISVTKLPKKERTEYDNELMVSMTRINAIALLFGSYVSRLQLQKTKPHYLEL